MTEKSHLVAGLGMELIKSGYKFKFITAAELVEELFLTYEEPKLSELEKKWLKFDAIILDDIGYVQLHNFSLNLCQFFPEVMKWPL